MGGHFPKSDYCFYEKEFTFHDKEEPVPYKRLIRLIEDKQHLYLYVAEQSGYMVDKGTVTGGKGASQGHNFYINAGATLNVDGGMVI